MEVLIIVVILITMLAAMVGVLFYLKHDINKIQRRLNVDEEGDQSIDVRLNALNADIEKNYVTQRQVKALGTDIDTRLSASHTALQTQLQTINDTTQKNMTQFKDAMQSEFNDVTGELRSADVLFDERQRVFQEEIKMMENEFSTRKITLANDWQFQQMPETGDLVFNNVNGKGSVVVSTGLNVAGKLGFASVGDGYTLGVNGDELRLNLPLTNGKLHLTGGVDELTQHSFDVDGTAHHMGEVLAPGISRTAEDKEWLNINQTGTSSEGTKVHGSVATDGGLSVGEWVKLPSGMLHVKDKLGIGTTAPAEALDVKGNARVNDLWIGSYVIFEEGGQLYIGKDSKTAKVLKISGTDQWRIQTFNNVDGSSPGWGVNNVGHLAIF